MTDEEFMASLREKLRKTIIQNGPSGVAELEEFKTLDDLPG